jgi:tripartite-type tricarboxylate transporter receptor subunit TctC
MSAIRWVAEVTAGMLCVSGAAWPQAASTGSGQAASTSSGQAASTGSGQAYPAKPVRVIVPFPPGGANDIIARLLLPKLSEQMGQQFIIENRTGAGGTIGTAAVAQSRPDGYTLLVNSIASHVSNPHLYRKLPYDAMADFVGVAPLGRLAAVLSVHPSMPTRSVAEFIALAKKRPKEVLLGHAGTGSFIHLNAVLLESMAGIQFTQVPFKGGGPAIVGLMSGETNAMIVGVGDIFEYIKTNRARALGVTTLERIAQLPGVPLIAETVPGYESVTWVSLFAPAGTPKSIIEQLNTEIGNAMRDSALAAKLSGLTYDPVHRPAEELNQRMRSDYEKIGKLFR